MSPRLYYVYVVELAPTTRPPFRTRGSRPAVYVGSSALSPERRFREHKARLTRGSRHVRRRGVRLLPRLYAGIGPFRSREDAHRAEHRLRQRLEARGYEVFGSCFGTEVEECWI